MQIVINMPDEKYERLPYIDQISLRDYIANGTPLPREHGDLVDRDEINNKFYAIWDELESFSNKPSYKELLDKLSGCLDAAKPVIKNNYEEVEEELWS